MTLEQLAALLIESYFYKKKQELGRHLTKSELDKVWRDILSEGAIPRKFDKYHDDIFKIIQTHVEVRQEEDVSIVKDVRRWLDKKKKEGEIEFPYWNRYKKLLLNSLPYDVVDTLDKSTDKIIDFSGDPQLKMDTRGLVMGEVQSGKTASYTGVICKAADLGYKVIIVVTTSNEKLRSQTQQRLDKEFVGYCNVSQMSTINIHGYLTGEEKRAESRTNILQDFGKAIKSATSFNPNAVSEPYFFVCKKETNNLNHLIKWLSENLNSEGKNDAPLLLIDDECDYASVNTKDPNKNPTRINGKLRDILDLFTRSSYIGYSATPFANVFIDPDMPKELKEDLFPRNFINYIKPPSNYNGREKIFGKPNDFSEDEDVNQRDEFITLIDDNEDIFPIKYKQDHEIYKLPESLKEAIRLYIITVALLELNDFKMHKTMMIHVSKLVRINKEVFELVSNFVEDMKNAIYACKDFLSSSDLEIIKLKEVFDDFYAKEKENIKIFNFEKVFKQLKELVTENWIQIQLIIGRRANIGYEEFFKENKKHMNVLMIGGDIISRGLTLEGLIISYFIRNPGGYDTLMQMARWFGYRICKGKSYEEACKIYMTSNSLKAYTDVNIRIDELIEELLMMEVTGKTPAEFGLRVSTSELLNITAKNKLRNSQILVLAGNFERKLVQANYVINNKTIQKENHQLLKNFFDKVSSKKSHNYSKDDKKPFVLYENIEGSELLKLLKSFNFSQKAEHFVKLDNKTGPLYEWIEKRMNDEKELKYWNIAIPVSPSKKKIYVDFLNTALPIVSRAKCKVVDGNLVLNVKEKTDFSRGVYATNEVIPLLNDNQKKKYEANKDKKIGPLKYLEKPTVLLYVIDFKLVEEKQEKLELDKPLATILLYLPSSEKKEIEKKYLVNKTYIKMLEKERKERDDEPGGDEEDD